MNIVHEKSKYQIPMLNRSKIPIKGRSVLPTVVKAAVSNARAPCGKNRDNANPVNTVSSSLAAANSNKCFIDLHKTSNNSEAFKRLLQQSVPVKGHPSGKVISRTDRQKTSSHNSRPNSSKQSDPSKNSKSERFIPHKFPKTLTSQNKLPQADHVFKRPAAVSNNGVNAIFSTISNKKAVVPNSKHLSKDRCLPFNDIKCAQRFVSSSKAAAGTQVVKDSEFQRATATTTNSSTKAVVPNSKHLTKDRCITFKDVKHAQKSIGNSKAVFQVVKNYECQRATSKMALNSLDKKIKSITESTIERRHSNFVLSLNSKTSLRQTTVPSEERRNSSFVNRGTLNKRIHPTPKPVKDFDIEKIKQLQRNKPLKEPAKDRHALQPDIEFEACELFRNMILNERVLSPRILKLCNGSKFSMSERPPSLYEKCFQKTGNPHTAALMAIENLAENNRRTSEMQRSGLLTPSTAVKEHSSVRKQPVLHPREEALKAIEALRSKTKKKAEKRVRFASPVYYSPLRLQSRLTDVSEKSEDIENLPNDSPDYGHMKTLKLAGRTATPYCKMPPMSEHDGLSNTQDCERSPTPTAPFESEIMAALIDNVKKSLSFSPPPKRCFQETPTASVDAGSTSHLKTQNRHLQFASERCTTPTIDSIVVSSPASSKDLKIGTNNLLPRCYAGTAMLIMNDSPLNLMGTDSTQEPIQSHNLNRIFNSAFSESCVQSTVSESEDKENTDIFGQLSYVPNSISFNEAPILSDISLSKDAYNPSKLCTPKPISLYAGPTQDSDISPDFFEKRDSGILLQHAPITTPLVLKALSKKNRDSLSPLSQNFVFEDDFECSFVLPGNVNYADILKRKDDMVNQECCVILKGALYPNTDCRSLKNPIVDILSKGDEMHFVPVK